MEEEVLKGKTLLVVDDETDLRDIVASELEFMGASVFQAENISIAQKILEQEKIDLIISDIRMPGGTGIDLLDYVKSKDVSEPVILITGFADITVEDAFDKGAEALMHKPFKLDDLIKTVVRYTSPVQKRFQEEGNGQKTIQAQLKKDALKLGRGGVSLPVDAKKIDVGEEVNLDLNIDNHHLAGYGICRWFRPGDGSHKAQAGIEFLRLDSLEQFNQLSAGKEVVAYIPSSNHA